MDNQAYKYSKRWSEIPPRLERIETCLGLAMLMMPLKSEIPPRLERIETYCNDVGNVLRFASEIPPRLERIETGLFPLFLLDCLFVRNTASIRED